MEITDKQVIAMLRGRAAALLAAADALEGKSQFVASTKLPPSRDESFQNISGTASRDTLRAYITQKKERPKNLAQFFNCPETTIREIVTAGGSGLGFNDRGWVVFDPDNDEDWDAPL